MTAQTSAMLAVSDGNAAFAFRECQAPKLCSVESLVMDNKWLLLVPEIDDTAAKRLGHH